MGVEKENQSRDVFKRLVRTLAKVLMEVRTLRQACFMVQTREYDLRG